MICLYQFSLPRLIIAVLLIVVGLSWAVVSSGGETAVKARYINPRGMHIKWRISIPDSPPAAVIVIQYILPGTEILETSHPLSSYDSEKGIAKWLLTSISPGILRMEMTLNKPIRIKGEIHGEVQLLDASQNVTSSIFMRPRTMKKALEGC